MELNCVTSLIADAEEQAVSLPLARSDEMPLFGLPVSLKESMNIKVSYCLSLLRLTILLKQHIICSLQEYFYMLLLTQGYKKN